MSRDWDVVCVDCDAELGLSDANHMDEMCQEIVKAAPALAVLGRANPRAVVSFYPDNPDMFRFKAAFFVDHEGHRLMPRDEYGGYLTQCAEYIRCGECGTGHRCRRKPDHPPPCWLSPAEVP